jgi:hypothetical protein
MFMDRSTERIIDDLIDRSGIRGGSPSLSATLAHQLVSRPAALAATRTVGFTDAALARLLDVTPMSVNDWVKARAAIPPARHAAIVLFITALGRFLDELMDYPPDPECAARARLLHEAAMKLVAMAINEGAMKGDGAAARQLATNMLAKLAKLETEPS